MNALFMGNRNIILFMWVASPLWRENFKSARKTTNAWTENGKKRIGVKTPSKMDSPTRRADEVAFGSKSAYEIGGWNSATKKNWKLK
jgi:hypothetical protein